MVGIALLLLASSVVGWKMHRAIKQKKFHSEVERFQARFLVCHKLAMAMQADWRGELVPQSDGWIFEAVCEENPTRKFPPLNLHFQILLNGQKQKTIPLDFFASGQVSPHGKLLFVQDGEKEEWDIEAFVKREEGTELGPIHPAAEGK